MVRNSTVVAIVVLLAITLNYLNEDVPDDLPGVLQTKIWLGSVKAVFALVRGWYLLINENYTSI